MEGKIEENYENYLLYYSMEPETFDTLLRVRLVVYLN